MKNPLTPAGIEPATFRFVAQHLNHYATAVPRILEMQMENKLMDKTKDLDYFIRQSLNLLPKFVIEKIPFVLTKFDFTIYTHCRS